MVRPDIGEGLDPDQKIWRYMSLAKFVSMLAQKSIWLARADTFCDKREGRFPDEMLEIIEKAYEGFPEDDPSPVKDAADFQDYLVKNTFISCWHGNLDENMVMWEIYGQRENAVALQTTVGRLWNSIDCSRLPGNFLILDKVEYARADQIPGVLRYERCFFIKRPHFQFEKEVRISLDTYDRGNPTKATPDGYAVPTKISLLAEDVLVHPDSSDWFLDAVISVTKKYGLDIEVRRGSYGNQ